MSTDNKTLAFDVLSVMDSASLSLFEVCRNADARSLDKARATVAELIEAAHAMSAVLHEYGQYDDGCFYYCGLSSPELERPLSVIDSALARVKGESA